MAKAAAKLSTKPETKKPRAPRAKASTNNGIEKVSEEALEKLRAIGIEEQLQRDLQWCLGSYRADHNPVGLYDIVRKVLLVLQDEKEKKTKGVTTKLINELEEIVRQQPD